MEALGIGWDAQARIEDALLNDPPLTIVSYDFKKFLDSFDHYFIKQMLQYLRVPTALTTLIHHLYKS